PGFARFIVSANGITEDLPPGRHLVIPELRRYEVAAGETLGELATRFYDDAALAQLIAAANDNDSPAAGDALAIFTGRADGFGLTIVDSNEDDARLWYYRFQTSAIGWNPGIDVLLPDGYHTSGLTYPVLYLLHGGGQDFRTFDSLGIRELTEGQPIVLAMPDGGRAGWYSNPTGSFVGPRNWETCHVGQLVPWIEASFRGWAERDGGGIAGCSMGGFGALKYTARYPARCASVSSHSGPASLRRDFG